MSVELIGVLIAVLAVGGTLAGMILTGNRGLRQDMARLESRLDGKIGGLESRQDGKIDGLESRLVARIDGLESRLVARIDGLESQINALRGEIGDLRERMAKLEGLLEGLREAITGRAAAG